MKKTLIIAVIVILVIIVAIICINYFAKGKDSENTLYNKNELSVIIKYNGLEIKNIKIQRDNEKTLVNGDIYNNSESEITLNDDIVLQFLDKNHNIIKEYNYYIGVVNAKSSKKLTLVVTSVLDNVVDVRIK